MIFLSDVGKECVVLEITDHFFDSKCFWVSQHCHAKSQTICQVIGRCCASSAITNILDLLDNLVIGTTFHRHLHEFQNPRRKRRTERYPDRRHWELVMYSPTYRHIRNYAEMYVYRNSFETTFLHFHVLSDESDNKVQYYILAVCIIVILLAVVLTAIYFLR